MYFVQRICVNILRRGVFSVQVQVHDLPKQYYIYSYIRRIQSNVSKDGKQKAQLIENRYSSVLSNVIYV